MSGFPGFNQRRLTNTPAPVNTAPAPVNNTERPAPGSFGSLLTSRLTPGAPPLTQGDLRVAADPSYDFLGDMHAQSEGNLAKARPVSRSPLQPQMTNPMQKFGNAMDTFDSYMNQGGEYLGQGLGALMRPVNSLIGGVMNPVGSILETAMSPINSIMGGLSSSPIGQMAGGFGKGVANYTSPEPQMDLSRLSAEQMAELMELLQNQIQSQGGQTP